MIVTHTRQEEEDRILRKGSALATDTIPCFNELCTLLHSCCR